MAKWENLKNAVAAVVKTNGNKEITGANMQAVLNSIINAVGGNAGFAGIATPTTQSGIPDGPTFYIATQGGTYSYFPTDGQGTPATIQDGVISVLYNQGNGLWSVTATPMSIADGSVTNAKLVNGAVTAEKIANGAVSTGKIANGAVDTAKIAEHTIRWENMDQGAVDKDILQDNAVIESKIKDGAVTEYKLGTNSVSQRSIINGAVTEAKLANNSVTGSKIAIGTITSAKIADGTITGNEIAPNSIESSNLSYGAVDGDILADGAVTTDKLAPFAVDTGNIENGAVTKGKLDEDVVAILDEVDNKANIDGFYDTMGVGTARNLLGKTSVVDTFFRKIIGVGVAKGNAYVDEVRGNSVAWNQVLYNMNFRNVPNAHIEKLSDGVYSVYTDDATFTGNDIAALDISNLYNHVLYVTGTPIESQLRTICMRLWRNGINIYGGNGVIYTAQSPDYLYIRVNGMQTTPLIFKPQIYDLTRIFGAGNEPATPEAFEAWLAAHVGEADYYAYDAGSLLSVKMVSLKSVGATIGTNSRSLDVTNITGINPTTGARERIFSDGMRSAGTVNDEIIVEEGVVKAIKRVGSVDLGSLTWELTSRFFQARLNDYKEATNLAIKQNCICSKYPTIPPLEVYNRQYGISTAGNGITLNKVICHDDTYSDAATFKTAMNGVMFFYELEEPVVYTDLQDADGNPIILPLGIPVEPLGTLEVLPQNTEGEALTMCAPTLSMQFSIDAAKILTDELPNEYRTNADDKANWQKFLAIMNEKLGGAMGGTISVDDAAVGHGLDFTFAAAQAENNRDVEPIEE